MISPLFDDWDDDMSDGGKGSKPRPIPNPEQFRSNWDLIFNKGKQNEPRNDSPHNVGNSNDNSNDVKK